MKKRSKPFVEWLPVDSRLIVPFLSFGHVHGIAKIFLTVEIVLAGLIVLGTFSIILLILL